MYYHYLMSQDMYHDGSTAIAIAVNNQSDKFQNIVQELHNKQDGSEIKRFGLIAMGGPDVVRHETRGRLARE